MKTNKPFYQILSLLLMAFGGFRIFWLVFAAFTSYENCLIDLPAINAPGGVFIGAFYNIVFPFVLVYIGLVLSDICRKPEKDNKLTKISAGLILGTFVFSYVVPFAVFFFPIILLVQFVSVVLLLIGNFNKYYFAICLGLVVIILGGIKLSENKHGCRAVLGSTDNSAKYEEVISKNDENLCAGLAVSEQKQYCYGQIALSKNDSVICGKMEDGQDGSSLRAQKNGCYSAIAKNSKNSKICELVLPEVETNGVQAKDLCYTDVAKSSGNANICLQINYSRQKDICIHDVASTNKDLKICNMLSDLSVKEYCISDVAKSTKDLKICDLVSSYDQKRYCVSEVAIATNKCDLVKKYGDIFYNSCLTLVEQNRKMSNP